MASDRVEVKLGNTNVSFFAMQAWVCHSENLLSGKKEIP